MIALLIACAVGCVLTGVRMVWSVVFGRERERSPRVPQASIVRDGKVRADRGRALGATAQFVVGAFLIAIGVVVGYIVAGAPL